MMRYLVASFVLLSLVANRGAIQSVRADEPQTDQAKDEARAAEALEVTREAARSLQFYGGEERMTNRFTARPSNRETRRQAGLAGTLRRSTRPRSTVQIQYVAFFMRRVLVISEL